ncbi:hypothetical protein [Luteipulveratus halotolerans]|uniref:Secreted protein n=1 Tax=Luteipulveratus halotolerans TaxID=1631356 RepID=A0A0L6CF94_9MICO|nr:hypothetical protein [Luteipulveratus halotolerans]KNX36457.1 hypothetical protein VV01_03710 [Luteipulveratus halotolerans]
MRHVLRRSTSGAAAALALVATAALTPAQADEHNQWRFQTRYAETLGEFWSYGEHLYIDDYKADGHGAAAQWRYFGSTVVRGTYHNGGGYGSSKEFNLSFPEGTEIDWRACLQDGNGPVFSCGPWRTTIA